MSFIFRKSSYSGGQGGNCVEIAAGNTRVLVRDTKARDGHVMRVSADAWTRFVGELKAR